MRRLVIVAGLLLGAIPVLLRAQVMRSGTTPGPAHANSVAPWEAVAFGSDPNKVASAVAALPTPDADVEILYTETTCRIDDRHRCETTTRAVYRCVTARSLKDWSSLAVTWAPWYEERPQIQARVITPDGKAHQVDPATIGESPVPASEPNVITDLRLLRVPFPAMQVGAVVEQEVLMREHRAFFERGSYGRLALASAGRIRKLRVTVDVPSSMPLHYQVRGLQLEPKRTIEGDRFRLIVEGGPIEAVSTIEPALAPDHPRVAYLVFSTAGSWQDVAAGYGEIVERQLHSGSLKAKSLAVDMVSEHRSPAEIARRLLSELQRRIRYTGVVFGAASIVPATPDTTLERGYGDCKDQSTLLVAMLRAAGCKAHVALLRSGQEEDVLCDVPSLGCFDHAIVYVSGDPPIWIDLVVPHVRLGELPWMDQRRQALVASPDCRGLIRLPIATSAENRTIETHQLYLSEKSCRIVVVHETHGTIEQEMRQSCAGTPRGQLQTNLQIYFGEMYGGGLLRTFDFTDVHDLSSPFRLTAELGDTEFGRLTDGGASLGLGYAAIFDRIAPIVRGSGSGATARQQPFFFEPHTIERRYEIMLPSGFVIAELPRDARESFGSATICSTFSREGESKVLAMFRFDSGPGTLGPREAASLAEHLRRDLSVPIDVELSAARLRAAGNLVAALQEYWRLVELNPDHAAAHRRYAEALRQAGFGKAARQHARVAVSLDPDSALAHGNLGFILSCDLFGRHLQPGLDWKAADAAFRKSLEIEPGHPIIRANYAELLQFDAAGNRIACEERLSAAIGYLKTACDTVARGEWGDAKRGVQDQLLRALFHAGRFQELARFAENLEPSPFRDAVMLSALAITDGTNHALTKMTRLGSDKDDRSKILIGVVELLALARRYDLAVEILDKGVPGDGVDTVPDDLRRVIPKLRRFETVRFPESDPRWPVQRLLWLLYAGYVQSKDIPALFAQREPGTGSRRIVDDCIMQLRPLIARGDTAGTRGDKVTLLEFTAEGVDSLAYRVRARSRLPDLPTTTWFVVKTDAGYRLWDVGERQWRLGATALAHVGKTDVEGAKQLLSWAWNEHQSGIGLFDRLGGTPFARFWGTAQQDDPGDLRIAAALLAAEGAPSQDVLEILVEATQSETAPARKLQIDRGLARVHGSRQRPSEMLAAAKRILSDYPRHPEPSFLCSDALHALGRTDEVRELAEMRCADSQADVWALHVLACLAIESGEPEKAAPHLQQLARSGELPMRVALRAGWNSLWCGALPPEPQRELLQAIIRVIEKTRFVRPEDADLLLEVAALQAEVGEPGEAQKALVTSVDWRVDPVLTVDHEFVIGRIAEQLQLLAVARATYTEILEGNAAVGHPHKSLVRKRLAVVGDELGNWWKAQGEYEKALAEYNTAMQLDPQNSTAFYDRGRLWHYELGKPDQALWDYTEALRLRPDFVHAFFNRALVRASMNQYDKAIDDYSEAIRLDPKDATAYYNRGGIHADQGEYEKAIADHTEAVRLDPKYARAYNNRGYAWRQKGERDRAIEDYNKAIELDPAYAVAYRNRGDAWSDKGAYDKAIADYSEAIRLDPKDAIAYNSRGVDRRQVGAHDEAIEDYTRAIELEPTFALAYRNRASVWLDRRECDKAIADYTRAIELKPDYAPAYMGRGVAWDRHGNFAQAIKDFSQVITLEPKNVLAYTNRAIAWKKTGNIPRAIADYDKALELDRENVGVLIDRGTAWQELRDYARARADFTTATKVEGEHEALARNNLAWLLASCPDANHRDGRRAVEEGRRACELTDWKKASFLDTLAAAYAESAAFDQAVHWQEQAMKLDSGKELTHAEARLALYRAHKPFRLGTGDPRPD